MDMMLEPPARVLAGELLMTLAGFDGIIVLVEGLDDIRVFRSMLNKKSTVLRSCGGKAIALEVIDIVLTSDAFSEARKKAIFAFVDADFDRLKKKRYSEAVILSDYHDLEVMIIWSDALDRYLAEYASADKLAASPTSEPHGFVRDSLIRICSYIGGLRLWSLDTETNVDFKNINHSALVDRRNLEVDFFKFCQGIYNNNRDVLRGISIKNLEETVCRLLEETRCDARDLVQGHDAIAVLGIMLRHAIGSCDAAVVTEDIVGSNLRLAYRPDDWQRTDMAEAFRARLSALEMDPHRFFHGYR